MAAIRDFFKKRKNESSFKKAGPGHKLSENKDLSAEQRRLIQSQVTQPRQAGPSEGAQRAGAAALARLEQHQQKNKQTNWSAAAIRTQARKELELEAQAKEKEKYAVKESVQDAAPLLAVSGVFFTCPLVGPQILPYNEIKGKIKEFLYDQLAEERGLTSCLIIHTCNPKDTAKAGIEILSKYLANIIDNPTEEKYRKIRKSNKVFQEKVSSLEGVYDFLTSAGFVESTLSHENTEESFYIFPPDADIENLTVLRDALQSAEPIKPELDRNLKVLLPSQASSNFVLPDDFFNISSEELLKEQELRAKEVELNTTLRTKAMRERDERRELRHYRYTLIRVRLPNGTYLQGTFGVYETLQAVREFLAENLADPSSEFSLIAPTGEKLTEDSSKLLDLHLVPAVILKAVWNTSQSDDQYLRQDILALVESV